MHSCCNKELQQKNIFSERDFDKYDRRPAIKPLFSTVAADWNIMYKYNMTSEWLAEKSNDEGSKVVKL